MHDIADVVRVRACRCLTGGAVFLTVESCNCTPPSDTDKHGSNKERKGLTAIGQWIAPERK